MERKSPSRLEYTRLLFLYTKCGRSIVALSGVLLIIIKPPPHDMIRSGTAFVSTASQCNILIDLRVFRESSAMLSVNLSSFHRRNFARSVLTQRSFCSVLSSINSSLHALNFLIFRTLQCAGTL